MTTSTTEMFKSLAVKDKRAKQSCENRSTVAESDDKSLTPKSKPEDAERIEQLLLNGQEPNLNP